MVCTRLKRWQTSKPLRHSQLLPREWFPASGGQNNKLIKVHCVEQLRTSLSHMPGVLLDSISSGIYAATIPFGGPGRHNTNVLLPFSNLIQYTTPSCVHTSVKLITKQIMQIMHSQRMTSSPHICCLSLDDIIMT